MSKEGFERELVELREKVIRLEERLNELTKRLDALSNYTRQLYEHFAKRR